MAKIELEQNHTILAGKALDDAHAMYQHIIETPIDESDDDWPGPFRDQSWRIAPVAMYFYEAALTRLCPCTPECWPVGDSLPKIDTYLDPLIQCLRKQGRKSIIARSKYLHTEVPHNENGSPDIYTRIPLDRTSIVTAIGDMDHRPSWYLNDTVVFDDTGTWATYDIDREWHLLGGTPAFMADYYEACGGEENARAWFYHFDITYCSHDRDRNFDGRPGQGIRLMYDLAKWPYPVYPDNEHGTTMPGDDIDWSTMFGDRIKSAGPRID